METIKNYNSDNQNTVDNNKNKNSMKRLNYRKLIKPT